MTCNYRRPELTTEAISSIFCLSDQSRLQFLNIKVNKGRCLAGHWAMGPVPRAQICSHGLLALWSGWRLTVLDLGDVVKLRHKATKLQYQRNSFL